MRAGGYHAAVKLGCGIRAGAVAALIGAAACRTKSHESELPVADAASGSDSDSATTPVSPPTVEVRRECGGSCPGWEQLTFPWHDTTIAAVTTSSDGSVTATLSFDGTLRTWNGSKLRPQHVFVVEVSDDDHLVVSPDGTRLAHAHAATLQWFDLAQGRRDGPPRSLPSEVVDLVILPSSQGYAVALADGTVAIAGQGQRSLDLQSPLLALAVSHDGETLAVSHSADGFGAGIEMGAVTLVSVATATPVREMLSGPLGAPDPSAYLLPQYDLAFDRDDRRLVGGGYALTLWDTTTGELLDSAELAGNPSEGNMTMPRFEHDGASVIFVAHRAVLARWSLGDGKLQDIFPGQRAQTLAVTHHARALIFSGGSGELMAADPTRGSVTAAVRGPSAGVTALAFSPNGEALFGGLSDGTLARWDLAAAGMTRLRPSNGVEINGLLVTPDGAHAFVGDHAGTLSRLTTDAGQVTDTLKPSGAPIYAMTECAAVKTLLVGLADGTVERYATDTLALRSSFKAHDKEVTGLDCSPDGAAIVTVSEDGTGKIWRDDGVTLGATMLAKAGKRAYQDVLWFDPSMVVSAEAFLGDDQLRVWSPQGNELRPLAPLKYGATRLRRMHQTRHVIAANLGNGGASVWDTSTGAVQAEFPGFSGNVMALAVSADGRAVAVGATGNEHAVRIWRRAEPPDVAAVR